VLRSRLRREFTSRAGENMRRPTLSAGLFWLAVSALLAQPDTPGTTIRVPVRLVTAPTMVFSREGRIIPGLLRTDFRVLDNNRPQKVVLDTVSEPVSMALAIQVSQGVRQYIPFIAKAGAMLESLLLGDSGKAAIITYADEVTIGKPMDGGDLQATLAKLSANGREARMIDAGLRGIALLKECPNSRTRILIFVGQSMDEGSETTLTSLREQAERENVTIYALTLPEFGRAFVSDTFSLQGVSGTERGGFRAGVDLGKLVPVIGRSSKAERRTDPFSWLTAATGGTQIHIRRQAEFESAIAVVGIEFRSAYLLSYSPTSSESGYHSIKVEVDVPGAKVCSRAGYWWMD
jgi:VWFA-related protein